MSATKHTPGPWRIAEDGLAIIGTGRKGDCLIGNGHEGDCPDPRVADVRRRTLGKPCQVRLANARLISAAPELLEVAKQLVLVPVRDCPWGCDPEKGHRTSCPAAMAARAWAKAEER